MTNGNSPKIASEIIDAILAYGDARADKDLVKGTASLKKSIELIRSALSVCADGGKDALGWTWERRYSNGGYTRKFCTSELEARELAKDGESLSIPDLVYPFFARADGGKGNLRERILDTLDMKGTFTDDQIVEAVWCTDYERRRLFVADGGKGEAVAWIRMDHLRQAQQAPFFCRVEPSFRPGFDFVPIYLAAPQAECAPRADCGETLPGEFTNADDMITALRADADTAANSKLLALHKELNKIIWAGADEGWDKAIEAVRDRIMELVK